MLPFGSSAQGRKLRALGWQGYSVEDGRRELRKAAIEPITQRALCFRKSAAARTSELRLETREART